MQAANAAESSEHWNVAPGEPVKLKLAAAWLVGFPGFAVIDGAASRIIQVKEVAPLTFPAASFAWTEKVCEPGASPEYDVGLEQPANEPASSLQRKPTPDSLSPNEKLGEVDSEGSDGFDVIEGGGGAAVSTRHAYEAGELWLPEPSVALTSNVCVPCASGPG